MSYLPLVRTHTTKHIERSAPHTYDGTCPKVRAESRGAAVPNASKPTRVPPLDSARASIEMLRHFSIEYRVIAFAAMTFNHD